MPVKADSPLRKVTLNLYEDDAAAMETCYGHGWSEQVRQLVHVHILSLTRPSPRRTLGDLND